MEELPPDSEVERLTRELALHKVNSIEWCRVSGKLMKAEYDEFLKLERSNPKLAVELLRRSAYRGYEPAIKRLFRPPTSVKSEDRGVDVVDLEGMSSRDLFILGMCAHSGVGRKINFDLSRRCMEKVVERGEDSVQFAQYFLAGIYGHGRGVQQNSGEALKWRTLAAENGDRCAQFDLANNYMPGFLIAGDLAKDGALAVNWYKRAVEGGLWHAQNTLGYIYLYGKVGIPKNSLEGFSWYLKAAEQGNPKAQCDVGFMYHEGGGTEQNIAEAAKWYRKAAEQGNDEAQEKLGVLVLEAQGNKVVASETEKLTAIYHLDMFAFKETHRIGWAIEGLMEKDPRTFFKLLSEDELLTEEMRYPLMEQLLKVTKFVPANMEVAKYRYNRLRRNVSKADKKSGKFFEITPKEIDYQISLLGTTPKDSSNYAEAQLILSHLWKMKNPAGTESQIHFLNAVEADKSKKTNKEEGEDEEAITGKLTGFHPTQVDSLREDFIKQMIEDERLKQSTRPEDAEAQYKLGLHYETNNAPDLALSLYRRAGLHSYRPAMDGVIRIADMQGKQALSERWRDMKQKIGKPTDSLKQSTESKDAEAQYKLARKKETKDPDLAFDLYRRAARHGHLDAMEAVAKIYEKRGSKDLAGIWREKKQPMEKSFAKPASPSPIVNDNNEVDPSNKSPKLGRNK